MSNPDNNCLPLSPLMKSGSQPISKKRNRGTCRSDKKPTFTWIQAAQLCSGHVDSIAGATGPLFSLLPPENATGNYVKIVQRVPVKIVLGPGENGDRKLRPGMNVVPDVYLQ